jgi:hypothetical protein
MLLICGKWVISLIIFLLQPQNSETKKETGFLQVQQILDDLLGGSNIERKRQKQSHNFMANRQERKRNIEGHKIKNIDQINCCLNNIIEFYLTCLRIGVVSHKTAIEMNKK